MKGSQTKEPSQEDIVLVFLIISQTQEIVTRRHYAKSGSSKFYIRSLYRLGSHYHQQNLQCTTIEAQREVHDQQQALEYSAIIVIVISQQTHAHVRMHQSRQYSV